MLALIAGQGALPAHLIAAAQTRPFVASLERFPPDTVTPDLTFRIEQLGSFLQTLKEKGVREVCFAGSLQRVPLEPGEIDPATMPLVPRMMEALKSGDDAALRTVLSFFEEAGLIIRAAHEIAPDLLPDAGTLGSVAPDNEDEEEAVRAAQVVAAMGAVDIGQACVVHRGQVLASEGVFGTDWMLQSLESRTDAGTGGLFFKAAKPGQDRRIDLPTIGPGTVAAAAQAGLKGIAIEQG
ncbi:MAG: UDP-2,3-diacylglucosamine diphosphatase LpxI, partial [Paracoccaceae bacterium]